MSRIQELTAKASFKYLSCNFMDIKSDPAKTVLDAYAIRDFGGKKVAFIGISTPESITKSTPAYFQDEDGNYIYASAPRQRPRSFMMPCRLPWNAAKAEGVDYVVAIAHLGIDNAEQPVDIPRSDRKHHGHRRGGLTAIPTAPSRVKR